MAFLYQIDYGPEKWGPTWKHVPTFAFDSTFCESKECTSDSDVPILKLLSKDRSAMILERFERKRVDFCSNLYIDIVNQISSTELEVPPKMDGLQLGKKTCCLLSPGLACGAAILTLRSGIEQADLSEATWLPLGRRCN